MRMSHFHAAAGAAMVCAVLLTGTTGAQTSGAVSQSLTPDARSQGMGRAFTALAEGPSTVWWNPAALGVLDRTSISPFSESRLVPELTADTWIHTYGASVSFGALGFGLHRSDLDYDHRVGTNTEGVPLGTYEPKESTTILGAGYDVAHKLWPEVDVLEASIGVGFKWFSLDLAPGWATANGKEGKGDGWDIDAGVLVGVDAPFDLADGAGGSYLQARATFVRRNAFDHRVEFEDQDQTDPLVVRHVLGFGAAAGLYEVPWLGHALTVRAGLERLGAHTLDDPIHYYGAEASILNLLFVRTGYIDDPDGQIEAATSGWGAGIDLDLSRMDIPVRRFGFRYDKATVPQASGFSDLTHESVTVWGSWR